MTTYKSQNLKMNERKTLTESEKIQQISRYKYKNIIYIGSHVNQNEYLYREEALLEEVIYKCGPKQFH